MIHIFINLNHRYFSFFSEIRSESRYLSILPLLPPNHNDQCIRFRKPTFRYCSLLLTFMQIITDSGLAILFIVANSFTLGGFVNLSAIEFVEWKSNRFDQVWLTTLQGYKSNWSTDYFNKIKIFTLHIKLVPITNPNWLDFIYLENHLGISHQTWIHEIIIYLFSFSGLV